MDTRQKEAIRMWHDEVLGELPFRERYEVLPAVMEILAGCRGGTMKVKGRDIVNRLNKRGIKCDAAMVRAMVHVIRTGGLLPGLLGDNKGYWIAENVREFSRYMSGGLRGRTKSLVMVYLAMMDQLRQACGENDGDDEVMLLLLPGKDKDIKHINNSQDEKEEESFAGYPV